jgi:hypothetical protein
MAKQAHNVKVPRSVYPIYRPYITYLTEGLHGRRLTP